MKYKRVLLKLSGEALSGGKGTGFDEKTCIAVAEQIKTIVTEGCQVAVVIGGGNFWRGRQADSAMDRTAEDQARRSSGTRRIRSACLPRS